MYQIPGVLSAATTPAPAVPQVRLTRAPPPGCSQAPEDGCAAGPAEAIPRQAEDRERIAVALNDVVVRRLFTAGLDLQAALGLMGDHSATGKICHAVDELDQAIRDIRDAIFDHPAGQWPPPGRLHEHNLNQGGHASQHGEISATPDAARFRRRGPFPRPPASLVDGTVRD